ncbi:MAG: nitrogenase component 1 [Candidatus Tectomicrobia bacterium]|uniref:Nitrogenase component 1 n=1 Tax=Tectimicrobiota bacterium TaxID=2528274 RepID=A0A932GNP6_UNCTE|nr:nitrogenase component 1 [Candidatus Tectomicrobia bacterium]
MNWPVCDQVMPWDKVDRTREPWEIARDYLEMRAKKQFEIVTFRDLLEKTEDTAASDWWEKIVPGYGSGLWCPAYYSIQTWAGLPNSVVVFHGPTHCVSAARFFQISYGGGGGGSYYWGGPFCFVPSTEMNERDAILGAPEKLKKAILEIDAVAKPEIIIVAPACAPSMIGEPMEEVIEDVRGQIQSEIIFVDAPGFKCIDEGDMIRLVTSKYCTDLMEEPKTKDKGAVNAVGDWRTSAWEERYGVKCNFPTAYDELNRILKRMGLKLKTVLPQAPLADIRRAPEAEFNVCTCPMFAYPICEEMKAKFGVPYSNHVYPLGIEATRNYIMAIADFFGKQNEAEALLREEFGKLQPLWDEARRKIAGKVALMDSSIAMTSVNRQMGYARMLIELGIEDVIFFNIAPSEVLGRREGVEYYLSQTINGVPYNPKFLWWPAPHAIKLSPVEVMEFLGLKPQDVLYLYGDLGWYAKAPDIDPANTAQVQSGIHWRRRRNVCSRSIFFSGIRGLLRDIINAVNTSSRGRNFTLYGRVIGEWAIGDGAAGAAERG